MGNVERNYELEMRDKMSDYVYHRYPLSEYSHYK